MGPGPNRSTGSELRLGSRQGRTWHRTTRAGWADLPPSTHPECAMHATSGGRTPLLLALTGIVALAWLELSLWSLSPYAGYLDHRALEGTPLTLSGEYLLLLGLFVCGWLLMSTAMMLPTSLPLIQLFQRTVHQRSDRNGLVALLVLGYLGVWSLVGMAAHLGDLGVHELVHRWAWLHEREWLIAVTTLTFAGALQLSPLKHACLTRCRSPLSFIAAHWGGGAPRRDALALGMRHGLFCVGCCWPLMLLMFAFACGNLGWMLGLGALMALEKNASWGHRLTWPIGVGLLLAAAAVGGPALLA